MLRKLLVSIVCSIAMSLSPCYAQQKLFYNFNVNNGLPSNHVYQTIIDTFGYVWIATTQGVLKYNGYKFKKFGEKDGLPKEDIWMLVEDEYNRVWINTKAYEIGYIKNDKYRGVIRSTNGLGLYPKQMTRVKGGVSFLNSRYSFGKVYDTIDFYKVIADKVSSDRILTRWTSLMERGIDQEGNLSLLHANVQYKLLKDTAGQKSFRKICTFPLLDIDRDKYFACNTPGSFMFLGSVVNKVFAYSMFGCKTSQYDLDFVKDEHILGSHQVGYTYHISTNKRRIVLDSNFRPSRIYWLKDLMPAIDTPASSLVWYVQDKLWRGFSTTSNVGMYQNLGDNSFRFIRNANFKEAKYIGCNTSNTQYWWQNSTRELIVIKPGGVVTVLELKDVYSVNDIAEVSKGKMLLGSSVGYYVFDELSGRVEPYLKKVIARYAYGINMDTVVKSNTVSSGISYYHGHNKLYGVIGDTIYASAIFRLCWTFCRNEVVYEKLLRPISQVSYVDMQNLLSYSYYEGKLEAYDIRNNKIAFLDSAVLRQLGVEKVKEIVVDNNSHNLFVLSNSGFYRYNWHSRLYSKIPLSLNSSACHIRVYKNKVVLLSEFGLVFYKTDSFGAISNPVYIPNSKYAQYRYLVSTRFYLDDSVVNFNTDKGMCAVSIPADNVFTSKSVFTDYRFIVDNSGVVSRLFANDTLTVAGMQSSLLFDVINPVGTGELSFRYRLDGKGSLWTVLNANEWYPTGMLPGRYNKVYLQAFDEGWYSDVFAVYVYVQPSWWQTGVGKFLIGSGILLLLLGVIFVASIFTKRLTDRANARKNMQTELKSLRTEIELKSIHAQINPHFIFNTLSTGLYFIKKNKMEDAYDHISAFSQLLRNYIGASRDKYIVLNEEIDNLRRYVTLQQSRFENLHEFDVEIGEGVNIYGEKIPALLLQPLVENAINHGLFHKTVPGRLLLKFEKAKDGALICIVEDNGVGRERSKEIKAEVMHKTQSYGTDLIKELIETFNKYEPLEISIEYIDKQLPETGTIVILTIKMLNQKEDKV